jgi:hypothetical protein
VAHYRVVQHDKKFIACFSPKCGCTTLKDWFLASLESPEPLEYAAISKYMLAPHELARYPHYRKIFFIRDPFRRLVSFYCGWVVRAVPLWCFADAEGRERLEGVSFSGFIHTLAALHARDAAFQHHLEPQLKDVEGIAFDRVIPIERLDDELRRLDRELGIRYEPKHLNVTPYATRTIDAVFDLPPSEIAARGIPASECFYNPALIEIVSGFYREDIEFYRRSFGAR